MTVKDMAADFTDMLKAHDHGGAAAKYNADTIVSYEAMEGPMAVCEGKAAVQAKSDWWYDNHEVHGGTVEGPYVNGDEFAVTFDMDVTVKATGERISMKEVAIYKVKDNKIISERFYY